MTVHLDARLQQEDRLQSFIVRDLSDHGFMGDCEEPVEVGSEVRLVLPKIGSVTAVVVWKVGERIGCRLRAGLRFSQLLPWFQGTTGGAGAV